MELTELREKLDAVDERIVKLFEERMEISEEVAAYKKAHDLPVLDESREQVKIEAVRKLSSEKNNDFVAELFEKIMELSRRRQEQIL